MKSSLLCALLLGLVGACTPADPRPSSRLGASPPVSSAAAAGSAVAAPLDPSTRPDEPATRPEPVTLQAALNRDPCEARPPPGGEGEKALEILRSSTAHLPAGSRCAGYGDRPPATLGEAVRQTWAAASCRAVDCGGLGPDQQLCVAVARSGDEGGFFYRVFFQIQGGKLVLPSVICDSAG